MPIAVRVVTEEEFDDWLRQTKSAAIRNDVGQLAAAQD
jgi:heme/copper-type cytochrome/quinol oxidase subunit 2